MQKPQISAYIACSLDGYIAKADGDINFLSRAKAGNEDYGFKDYISEIDAVIMGRNTYDVVAPKYGSPEWPYTGKKMTVLSSKLSNVLPGVRVYSGDLKTLVGALGGEGIRRIWVDGGQTVSQFIDLGLLDTITVSIIPTLLGGGLPLFSVKQERPCHLLTTESYANGLVQVKYGFS